MRFVWHSILILCLLSQGLSGAAWSSMWPCCEPEAGSEREPDGCCEDDLFGELACAPCGSSWGPQASEQDVASVECHAPDVSDSDQAAAADCPAGCEACSLTCGCWAPISAHLHATDLGPPLARCQTLAGLATLRPNDPIAADIPHVPRPVFS